VSPSITVGPRIEFDPDHYPRLRVWNPREGRDHYVYLHRLTAFAQGEIEDLWSECHVHHEDDDGWNNHPRNLSALDPEEHDAVHGRRVVRRADS